MIQKKRWPSSPALWWTVIIALTGAAILFWSGRNAIMYVQRAWQREATDGGRLVQFWVWLGLATLYIAVMLFVGLISSWKRSNYLSRLIESEQQRRILTQHYSYLVRYANDVILIADGKRCIVEANDRASSLYGYSIPEFLDLTVADLEANPPKQIDPDSWGNSGTEVAGIYETQHRRKDGTIVPVELSSRSLEWEGSRFIQYIIRDISERKSSEKALLRANRLYTLLSRVNRAIIHQREREPLFAEICRVAVETGGFSLAWIGTVPDGEEGPRFLSHHAAPGYQFVRPLLEALTSGPESPCLDALRNCRPCVVNELTADARLAPISQAGFRSLGAFPFAWSNGNLGVIAVYSDEPLFFSDEIVDLLEEIADELAFAMGIAGEDERKREAEQMLRASEERYRELIASSRDPIAIYEAVQDGTDFIFKDFNRAAEIIDGVSRCDILGRSVKEVFSGVREFGLLDVFRKVWLTGAPASHPVTFYRDNRISGWRENYVFRLTSGEIVAIYKDLTEKMIMIEDLQQSEFRFRVAFENAPVGMLMIGLGGDIIKANRSFSSMVGYDPTELQTIPYTTLFHSADASRVIEANRMLIADRDRTESSVKQFFRKGGSVCWGDCITFVLTGKSGDPLYLVEQVQDITQRKAMEEELRLLTIDLEKRVADRTRQLAESNRELESFSYSVSHDLQAPLRVIEGFSRIIDEEHGSGLNEDGVRLFRMIRQNTQKMSLLIEKLLGFSRTLRQEIVISTVDMKSLVQAVFHELVGRDKPANGRFEVGILPDVEGDIGLLRQVWMNLIGNALKFTSRRESPRIEIGSLPDDSGHHFFIRDNGVGFDMQYASKLFQVFHRLHPAGEFTGTGVGLALVQRILQRHGGRIWAEAKEDEGAVFHFILPCGNVGGNQDEQA